MLCLVLSSPRGFRRRMLNVTAASHASYFAKAVLLAPVWACGMANQVVSSLCGLHRTILLVIGMLVLEGGMRAERIPARVIDHCSCASVVCGTLDTGFIETAALE